MPSQIIKQIIAGEYYTQGEAVHVPVRAVYIDAGIANYAPDLLISCGLHGRALVVSDENTRNALGGRIEAAMGKDAGTLVFDTGVRADSVNVEKIRCESAFADYIIAVGSGTINDLCKYASFLEGKPYVVFGTAPSMNGYGSANASITVAGHKKTLAAHLPQAIFLDLDVLAQAPLRLIRSGLGDSICRSTAQGDWLLSHLLCDTFYTEIPFELLREAEKGLFANCGELIKGDREMMRLLAATLVLSGFGMYIAGGSYPASQGEHMIAHLMEMASGGSLPHSYHGEQIGITTLTMAGLQEDILNRNKKPEIKIPEWRYNTSDSEILCLQPEILRQCMVEYQSKLRKVKQEKIQHRIDAGWENIRQKILSVTLPRHEIYTVLEDAGCPVGPEDIGWGKRQYEKAVNFACFTRDRFTFLDIGWALDP